MAEKIIIASELVKYYKEHGFSRQRKLALDKLNLEVNQGDTVALLGPNGAGKTTLLRIIFGLVLPTSGEVKVFGTPCEEVSWKNRAGYVPEFFTPPRFLKGRELLEIVAKTHGLTQKQFEDRLSWVDQAIGLKDILPMPIRSLSRGMLQQLALAQAVMHDPELLVLDEPTANLDAISRKKLKNLILGMSAQGKTILISSHILSEVEELCGRVIFLDKGRVVQQGKTKDLVGTDGGYLIRFKTPVTMPEQLKNLGALVPDPEPGITGLETRTEMEKDLAVKALIEKNISIESLEQCQKTLEQLFLELLEEKILEKVVTELMSKNEKQTPL
jgi:ABC-2 type transport system ATP-binding protein